ncbi:MAG TPA: M3 family metallopeptidase [Kofleriaceae bacterium]|nr:M3 family metallopeptidase [Kofleriaceae bacterium]
MKTRALSLLLLFVACGGKAKPPAPEPTPPTDVTATPPAPTPTPAPTPPPAPPAPPPHVNPLFQQSTLYLQAPAFDQLQESDYMPAFTEGIAQENAEIQKIADASDPPTFDNTIVALEQTGDLLARTEKVFFNLSQSLDDDTMEQIKADIEPKLAEHADDIHLNPKLFARIDTLYKARKKLGLDPVSLRLLERYHLDYVRAGANLNAADQEKLRALNKEESTLETKYSELQIKEMNAGAIVVDDVKELDGLSPSDIAAAAEAAHDRKLDGKWVLPLINTTGQPEQASLTNRALRERIYRASIARGRQGNDNDVTKVIARLAQLRAQKAKLLGFSSFDAYTLDDQMAKTPKAAIALTAKVATAALKRAKVEAADMQKLIDGEKGGFKLQPWDWDFYSEKVRAAKYALDEAQIRPYFELEHVLNDGVFFAAHQLYGLTFKQRTDLPVYQPDVRVYEVFDADGSTIGLIYLDYFARESKHGGAWMDSFVDQSDLRGRKAVVVNVLNVPKPAPGQPALLTFDDVTTMFHEFGHGLHGLLSNVKYPYMSGTATPRDFVEFPSQFNENWALEPAVLANYAKHYQTGAAMPADLVEKIKKSSTFNQGFATLETLEAALIDLEWHALPATAPLQDPDAFELSALKKYGVDFAPVPPRYHSTYFSHIWGGGYAAGYYAYLWTAVLAADAYQWFGEHGGMTAANGKIFRDAILSRGGTVDAHDLYVKFRGKEPSPAGLIKQRGL